MLRRLIIVCWLTLGLAALPAFAAALPPVDMHSYEERAADVLASQSLTDPKSDLGAACDGLLLACQAVAVTLIVAGLISKMRRDQAQMEGIASMMLKVAFIALVPVLRSQVLQTADLVADAISPNAAAPVGTPAASDAVWRMLEQWVPPGSPYLDVLQTQSSDNRPASGAEEAWALEAWNWARGIGTTTAGMFEALWQSISGGMRAGVVFVACGAMVCLTALTLVLCHLAHLLRFLLFDVGCAILPIFIAALGLDSLRAAAARYLVGLVTVACWPVGWALAGIVTTIAAGGLTEWMKSATAAALDLQRTASLPTLAIAAPYISWGGLGLFVGATVALCLWVVGTMVYGPMAISKWVSTGAQMVGAATGVVELRALGRAGSAARAGAGATDPRTPITSRPLPAKAEPDRAGMFASVPAGRAAGPLASLARAGLAGPAVRGSEPVGGGRVPAASPGWYPGAGDRPRGAVPRWLGGGPGSLNN